MFTTRHFLLLIKEAGQVFADLPSETLAFSLSVSDTYTPAPVVYNEAISSTFILSATDSDISLPVDILPANVILLSSEVDALTYDEVLSVSFVSLVASLESAVFVEDSPVTTISDIIAETAVGFIDALTVGVTASSSAVEAAVASEESSQTINFSFEVDTAIVDLVDSLFSLASAETDVTTSTEENTTTTIFSLTVREAEMSTESMDTSVLLSTIEMHSAQFTDITSPVIDLSSMIEEAATVGEFDATDITFVPAGEDALGGAISEAVSVTFTIADSEADAGQLADDQSVIGVFSPTGDGYFTSVESNQVQVSLESAVADGRLLPEPLATDFVFAVDTANPLAMVDALDLPLALSTSGIDIGTLQDAVSIEYVFSLTEIDSSTVMEVLQASGVLLPLSVEYALLTEGQDSVLILVPTIGGAFDESPSADFSFSPTLLAAGSFFEGQQVATDTVSGEEDSAVLVNPVDQIVGLIFALEEDFILAPVNRSGFKVKLPSRIFKAFVSSRGKVRT